MMSKYKSKLLNLKRSQYILYILILTLVVVVFWIGGGLFSSQRNTGISAEVQRLARPLNPNIDAEVLTEIQNKRVFETQDLSNFPIYMISRSEDGGNQQIIPIGSDLLQEEQTLTDVANQVVEDESLPTDEDSENTESNDNSQSTATGSATVPENTTETTTESPQNQENDAQTQAETI